MTLAFTQKMVTKPILRLRFLTIASIFDNANADVDVKCERTFIKRTQIVCKNCNEENKNVTFYSSLE